MQDYMQLVDLPAPVFAIHLLGFASMYTMLALLPCSCETSLLSSSIDPCPPAVELLPYRLFFDEDQRATPERNRKQKPMLTSTCISVPYAVEGIKTSFLCVYFLHDVQASSACRQILPLPKRESVPLQVAGQAPLLASPDIPEPSFLHCPCPRGLPQISHGR